MSSVVISGDTSGSVTLQAPAVSGTTVLTLPATSGTVITTASGTASSATTATNLTGGVAGAVPYQSGAGATGFSAAGTSGQLLQSNGVSAPTWVTPSSGALTFLSTVTASASATVDIETTFSSTYDAYLLYVVDLTPATAGTIIYARLKIGGSYVTSATYTYAMNRSNDASGYLADNSAGDTTIRLSNNCSLGQMTINIYSPSNTTKSKMINWQGVSITSTPNIAFANGVAYVTGTTAAMTGIRIFADTGNITSGTFRLYGVSNS